MFDFDYDILYQSIKDKELKCGKTLEQLLSQHLTSKQLENINTQLPTLTIFVPSLPENAFSAENWNVEHQSPAVAVDLHKNNNIFIYFSEGYEVTVPITSIPGFPTVVIKENERVIYNSKVTSKSFGELNKFTNNCHFEFINETFNNLTTNIVTKGRRPPQEPKDPINYLPDNLKKVLEAYNIYQNTLGWQRDYVYYNISPSNDKGPFDYNYKEYLVGFELIGDANGVYNKLSDQDSDPTYFLEQTSGNKVIRWTDGEYEFKIKIYYGNKSGIGGEYTNFFRLKPTELYEPSYNSHKDNRGNTYHTFKELTLERARLSIPLFEWNLENYSSNIKIAIEEVDGSQTVRQTTTSSTEFATNFSFDASFGETIKVGAKYGTSKKQTMTVSYEISETLGNDELGEVIINFADPIITSNELNLFCLNPYPYRPPDQYICESEPQNYNSKYSTGWYRLFIAPKKTN